MIQQMLDKQKKEEVQEEESKELVENIKNETFDMIQSIK